MKQVEFDIELVKKIQSGEVKGRVLTRDGENARFLGEIHNNRFPLIFAYAMKKYGIEEVSTYTREGLCHMDGTCTNRDIILEIEEPKQECQFKPFDKVLVRDSYDEEWMAGIFSHMTDLPQSFACVGNVFVYQCIPYEGNEHLIGTTDKPKED